MVEMREEREMERRDTFLLNKEVINMTNSFYNIEKLKEEFRNIFWAYYFRRNTKLNDKQSLKRLKELQKIFIKENITTV